MNLKTGKASNVGGSIDVIVGNNIANIILDGAGCDVLIGGLGMVAITAGADEDLLIGGRTDFDSDAIALQAIGKTWRLPSLDYANRIAKLIAGVGLGAATKLNATTVHNDLITDALFGETEQDWFFAHLTVGGPLPGIDITEFDAVSERNR